MHPSVRRGKLSRPGSDYRLMDNTRHDFITALKTKQKKKKKIVKTMTLTRLPCRIIVSSRARTHFSRSSASRAWKWNVLWSTVMVKVLSSSSSIPITAPFNRTQPLRTPRIIFSFDWKQNETWTVIKAVHGRKIQLATCCANVHLMSNWSVIVLLRRRDGLLIKTWCNLREIDDDGIDSFSYIACCDAFLQQFAQ